MSFLGFGKKKPTQQEINQANAQQANVDRVRKDASSRSWADVFGIQDQLDSGEIGSTPGVFSSFNTSQSNILGIKGSKSSTPGPDFVGSLDKNNFASSILGGTDAIGAYKKRKLEQQTLSKQGIGQSQSILGGSVI